MKTKKYSKENLILLLKEWVQKNGAVPSKRQLNADADMPSEMAYRKAFGSWGAALKCCGFEAQKPHPSENCRKAVSEAKKGKIREKSSNWKGGRFKNKYGYIMIWDSEKKKYVREHRRIMEEFLGRKLLSDEDVHHKNGIKDDNRIENLEVIKKPEHTSFHEKLSPGKHTRKNGVQCLFPGCEKITSSKYGLCSYHYRAQWGRLKNGTIKDMHDFSPTIKMHTEETKERLREYAKQQKRKNGRFSS